MCNGEKGAFVVYRNVEVEYCEIYCVLYEMKLLLLLLLDFLRSFSVVVFLVFTFCPPTFDGFIHCRKEEWHEEKKKPFKIVTESY